jgi:hypothetical protein
MKVIRHQGVRMNLQLMADGRIPQREEEEQAVLVGAEDVTSVVSPVDDVLRQVCDLNATSACHTGTYCMKRIRRRP